jgi:hypothetical protein
MKRLITSYTFSAAAKTIICSNFSTLENILLITNVTDNIIIYNFAEPLKGGTLSGTTLTLVYNTTTMSDSDKLQIFIDDAVTTQTVLQPTGSNLHTVVDSGVITSITNVVPINDNSGSLTVDQSVGANLHIVVDSGALTQVTNLTQLAGVAPTLNTGVRDAGTRRVTIATNDLVIITHGKTIKSVSGSLTADTDVIAAVSTRRLKVVGYSLTSSGVNANTVMFKSNGAAGTELWRLLLQSSASISAGANLATAAPGFLFATVAGEKLTIDVNQTDTLHYSISYFDDDTT